MINLVFSSLIDLMKGRHILTEEYLEYESSNSVPYKSNAKTAKSTPATVFIVPNINVRYVNL